MLHWRTRTDEFGASEWEPRVADLRAAIPAGAVVGYLSEKDLPESQFNPGDQLEEMLLTQYYLAPRILVPGADAPLVIGNFGREKVDPGVLVDQYGLRIQMDLGGGIYLLERSGP